MKGKGSFKQMRSKSQDADVDFDKMMEANKEGFELDVGLYELRRKYMEMKKERLRSQKDADMLENKLKLLSNEETKVHKREEKEKKSHEEMEKIRGDLLMEKEMLYQMKLEKEKDVANKRKLINEMREHIKTALSGWRDKIAEKNKNESLKMKMQKIENLQLIEINKKEQEMKNKTMRDQVIIQKLNSSEKKKKEEIDKKIKMKQELEALIAEEEKQKNFIEEKLNDFQEAEIELIKRIKTTTAGGERERYEYQDSYASPKKTSFSSSKVNGYRSGKKTK